MKPANILLFTGKAKDVFAQVKAVTAAEFENAKEQAIIRGRK